MALELLGNNKFRITINSIMGGMSNNVQQGFEGQYNAAFGIDPDQVSVGSNINTSAGILMPGNYTDFSGSILGASDPYWIINEPKASTELIYTLTSKGELISYTTAFGTETLRNGETFTVTIASPAVFTITGHGLTAGEVVHLTTSGSLPTGLTAGTSYYVIAAGLTSDAFQVSITPGGSAENTSGSQSGTHTLTRGFGQGGAYYNNYIYMATRNNVLRYGPLDGSASLGTLATDTWTGTTFGSQTALTDTAYPTINALEVPNHALHVHSDGSMYFGDFINGQGLIHKIKMNKGTDEGDTNNGTAYNVLDLPFGYAPAGIESLGESLAILAFPVTSHSTFRAGRAALFLWDPTESRSFYQKIDLHDDLATAILNVNGTLYTWSGSRTQGHRVSRYTGGYSFEQIAYLEYADLPFQGGVTSLGPRVFFGSNTIYPDNSACVFSLGYKFQQSAAVNCPISVSDDSNSHALSISRARADSFLNTDMVVGEKGGKLYRRTGNADVAAFRSLAYQLGAPYVVTRVVIPLDRAVAVNHTIAPILLQSIDIGTSAQGQPGSNGVSLTTINNTNFANNERHIVYNSIDFNGVHDLMLQLRWSGTSLIGVKLPIIIEGELKEQANFPGA